ncbi:glycosyltransferase [Synechococcales cyanobacterium C]|uniref:Glycosyltransferase n=1 Tax=Petrachloros mirabilis ULC683 TaxID=2781853 RepID=A0A8K2A0N0_9CYAN|nr:glycosyltransferase [Petrachloros mirabilis]NCJ07576.1 glycosyltransferase [Petrachloros mirabilis ULC683]
MTALQQSSNQSWNSPAAEPEVTIIVVPRERFQFAQDSLESLYEVTSFPFQLIYVDNNSPAQLQRYLATQAAKKGFQIVRSDRYLSPNAARNLGLQQVSSPYVVFVDNDVIFAPGWLDALVSCAQETDATVVGSLVCQYQPVHETIHCAGGEYIAAEAFEGFVQNAPAVSNSGGWHIYEKTYYQNRQIDEVRDRIHRQPTGFVEFHAMLVQTAFFREHGPLDEGLCCTKEYLDFAMTVARAGGTIYLEPASVVTFLTHPPAPRLQWADLPYFSLRWSDAWERSSLQYFQKKWHLADSRYFQKRYQKLGWRRWEELIKPRVASLAWLGQRRAKRLEKQLLAWEKKLNSAWCNHYTRTLAKQLGCSSVAIADGRNHPPITLSLPPNHLPRPTAATQDPLVLKR